MATFGRYVRDTEDKIQTDREELQVADGDNTPANLYGALRNLDFVTWGNANNPNNDGYLKLYNVVSVTVTTDTPSFIFPMAAGEDGYFVLDESLDGPTDLAISVLVTSTQNSEVSQAALGSSPEYGVMSIQDT